jgi:hypothetical protein
LRAAAFARLAIERHRSGGASTVAAALAAATR